MRSSRFQIILSVTVAGSLCFSSSAAVAATIPAPAPMTASSAATVSPWVTLSMLSSGAAATALCGAAAAVAAEGVAQAGPAGGCVLPVNDVVAPVAAAEPPPPVPVPTMVAPGGGFGISPLLLGLGALAIGALVYFLVRGKHHNNNPASPA